MNLPIVRAIACVCVCSFTAVSIEAAPQPSAPGIAASSAQQLTNESALSQNKLHDKAAQEWSLTSKEYERYQEVMRGPRGVYSPGLDPLTALGIEARSDSERRRYAELQVQAERQRVDRELAYQRAYDEAYQRLFPGIKSIEISDWTQSHGGMGYPNLFTQKHWCRACVKLGGHPPATCGGTSIRAADSCTRPMTTRPALSLLNGPATSPRARGRYTFTNRSSVLPSLAIGLPGS